MPRTNQTEPMIQGDLMPRFVDNTDLRNDNAGASLDQKMSIILRYLETAKSDDFVDFTQMIEDITRHWPFHGAKGTDFQEAVDALIDSGVVVSKGDHLQINKVARVARGWLLKKVRSASK